MIFIRYKKPDVLNEAAVSKEDKVLINEVIQEFVKNITDDANFQQVFFGHAVAPDPKTGMIPYKVEYDRRQIVFKACDSNWKLTDEGKQIIVSKINSIVSEKYGQFVCDNSLDAEIRSCHRDITGNAHFTVLNADSSKAAINRHLFTIKLPMTLNKNTAFKEGSKVLFINYMIKHGLSSLETAITRETYPNFITWLEALANSNSKTKGMTNADFEKMHTYFTASDYDTVKPFIQQYCSSCDMICRLAGSTDSYVTRDESLHGALRQFKQYVSETTGAKPGKKAHPADLIMVGSKFDKLACAISNTDDDTLYCAISLKEQVARWGKATSAVTSLKAKYNDGNIDTLEHLRDAHLYSDIDAILKTFKDLNNDNEKTQLQSFEEMCNRFVVYLPSADGQIKPVRITAKHIKDIDKLDTVKPLNALSANAISNLFFSALLVSHNDINDTRAFFAYLINSSLQLGTTPYYIAKDGQDDLISMEANSTVAAHNIRDVECIYTASGDIKVTNIFVNLQFSSDDNFSLPTSKHNDRVEVDVRQNGRGRRNSVIEFK